MAKENATPLQFPAIATPSNPPSGAVLIYAKTDGFYQLESSGVETKLGNVAGGGGGGNPALTTIEVDLGIKPRKSGRFTFAVSGQTVGKPLSIFQAVAPYTGKGTRADEAEMDTVVCSGYVKDASTVEVFWQCSTRVRGNRKFNYFIGA
jgi:hypothetical protein